MKKTILTAVFLGSAAPVFAAGFEEPAPAPVVVQPQPVAMAPAGEWTGFFAGAQLGWGDANSDLFDGLVNEDGDDFDLNGAVYGVHAGYMHDFGTFVLGGQLDYNGASMEDEYIVVEQDSVEVDVHSVARARLLMGYDAGQFMPFLTAGGANLTLNTESGGVEDELEDSGAVYGIGALYRFNERILVGGEVLQHDFNDFDDTGEDVDVTTVEARVSFQF